MEPAFTSVPPWPSSSCRRRRRPGSASGWSAFTTGSAASRRTRSWPNAIAAAAGVVHANDRRRVVRALELVEAGSSLRPEEDRLWGEHTRHSTLIVGLELPRDELQRRIEARTYRMFEQGVEEEVRRALEGPVSNTARAALGLREVAELPREQAIDALIVRTRRYAAYQRKWMRRIPGLVPVRADRPPAEVAEEILGSLARAG